MWVKRVCSSTHSVYEPGTPHGRASEGKLHAHSEAPGTDEQTFGYFHRKLQGPLWVAADIEHPVRVGSGPAHKAVTHQVENPTPVLAAVGHRSRSLIGFR